MRLVKLEMDLEKDEVQGFINYLSRLIMNESVKVRELRLGGDLLIKDLDYDRDFLKRQVKWPECHTGYQIEDSDDWPAFDHD